MPFSLKPDPAFLPFLEQLKTQDSFTIQRDDLAIENLDRRSRRFTASRTVGNFA